MTYLAGDINSFLREKRSTLHISFLDEEGDYWRFEVHNHSVWPDVDACQGIRSIKLEEEQYLYSTSAPWEYGCHGTSVPNMLRILAEEGFNNRRSGDTSAGICFAPKFDAAYSYNHGVLVDQTEYRQKRTRAWKECERQKKRKRRAWRKFLRQKKRKRRHHGA